MSVEGPESISFYTIFQYMFEPMCNIQFLIAPTDVHTTLPCMISALHLIFVANNL